MKKNKKNGDENFCWSAGMRASALLLHNKWASSSQNISAPLASLTKKRVPGEMHPHARSAPQKVRVSFPAVRAHAVHFLNAAGAAGVLQVLLGRKVRSCNFLLQSNCADAPRCRTEKRINQTARNLLREFPQEYETMVGARNKCHDVRAPLLLRGRRGKPKRKGHLQFWCLSAFCS